ncbi:MoaD/ThiS family protein, partial [Listeria monocytogenes]
CMLAVNMEFQQDQDFLPEEITEIAVIPPVSGG